MPEDLPVEDIRHALYKFESVVEVVRLHICPQVTTSHTPEKVAEGILLNAHSFWNRFSVHLNLFTFLFFFIQS